MEKLCVCNYFGFHPSEAPFFLRSLICIIPVVPGFIPVILDFYIHIRVESLCTVNYEGSHPVLPSPPFPSFPLPVGALTTPPYLGVLLPAAVASAGGTSLITNSLIISTLYRCLLFTVLVLRVLLFFFSFFLNGSAVSSIIVARHSKSRSSMYGFPFIV